MNYAWVIDQTKCIGCHACSTACKSENDVPLGVHRTWVKAVEVGEFPAVRRHFAVLRCNHCADPPCVHICPVKAMFQRPDGIVDIDHDRCIGCKACMQACPYDAIHIDPGQDTVAKCHFCAHRVDNGLLPACVVVCPVEALVFGDMDDPSSRVARYLESTPVTVRRPEQNTRPKAFYVGAHQAALDPLAATHGDSYMFSERVSGTAKDTSRDFTIWSLLRSRGADTRPSPAGHPRVVHDVHHMIVWKGKVSAYLWTKSVAAGSVFLAATAEILGLTAGEALLSRVAPLIAMVALGITGILLVADLKRPERFWFIILKPQWRSWLTKGAFIISAYAGVLLTWLVYGAIGRSPPTLILWLALVLAFATAVYTAFLFAQCEARDLWQSRLLGLDLTIQMVVGGAATLLVAEIAFPASPETVDWLTVVLLWALGFHVVGVLLGKIAARRASSNAVAASHVMTRGRYAPLFWAAVIVGTAVPAGLLLVSDAGVPVAAGLALMGLLAYEHAFVMSGQSVPIS